MREIRFVMVAYIQGHEILRAEQGAYFVACDNVLFKVDNLHEGIKHLEIFLRDKQIAVHYEAHNAVGAYMDAEHFMARYSS